MKKIIAIIFVFFMVICCKNPAIEPPINLISEEKMVQILYDLAVLDAIRAINNSSLETRGLNSPVCIYKKYNIDSLQFAKNNKFYASDISNYAKIYEKVNLLLETKKAEIDTLMKQKTKKKK